LKEATTRGIDGSKHQVCCLNRLQRGELSGGGETRRELVSIGVRSLALGITTCNWVAGARERFILWNIARRIWDQRKSD